MSKAKKLITGNKGDWSEIYALLKILGDGKIFAGDANLKKIATLYYPIVKVIRNEISGTNELEVNRNIIIISDSGSKKSIRVQEFINNAATLLDTILKSSGSFSSEETQDFMEIINCKTIKAKSTSKTDISIVIHDQKINQNVELGFSIKSQLGSDSTLLNAGRTTNFIYKILGFTGSDSDVSTINKIETKSKIRDRISEIIKFGGKLDYFSTINPVFKNNLVLIDSLLPEILAELIRIYYSSNFSTLTSLTKEVAKSNPLSYDTKHSHSFYEYKIKKFLTDVALGLMPSKVWNGQYDATGGYLIVKEDGDVLCYHIYNRNQFEDYLFQNTKLETASTSRHDFGTIYRNGVDLLINLNLQIRFV